MMNITAFGETKPLEQHLWDVANDRRDQFPQDITNLMLAAYATIECSKIWLKQADEREAALMQRLDRIERLVQPRELRWLVTGKVNHTPYMNDARTWEDTRIIMASTRDEAERLFTEYWDAKSEQHGDSYHATVTRCSAEMG